MMMAAKLDWQEFLTRADGVAVLLRASDVFGLLTRTLDLPASWAGLVTLESGSDSLVKPGGILRSDDADELLLARTSPVDVRIEHDGLATKDRFQCSARVTLRPAIVPDRAELRSFRNAILGSDQTVIASGVARYLQSAVVAALAGVAGDHEVSQLVDGDGTAAAARAIAEAIKGPCFKAGLCVSAEPVVEFESESFRKVRRAEERLAGEQREHEASQALREATAQAQNRHLDHVTGLLTRVRDLAAASPDVELVDLLKTFSEDQRGELYQALAGAASAAEGTRFVVVAAGQELLFFDPGDPASPARRVTVEGSVGRLRSVQAVTDSAGAQRLLVGAATGVYGVSIDSSAADTTFTVPRTPDNVRGGFNAAVLVGERVLATHSELGLFEWSLDKPDAGEAKFEVLTRDAQAVRGVAHFDGDLYCSVDDRVIRWRADVSCDKPAQTYTGAGATITAVEPSSIGLFAGTSDGRVLHWPTDTDSKPQALHAGGRRAVESVRLLSSHGVRRLVFTDTSLHVYARVVGDSFVCRYEAGGQTLRRVEVAGDLLAATNDLRDRIILWSPGQPEKPRATVGVSRICRTSVQDVCLVSGTFDART